MTIEQRLNNLERSNRNIRAGLVICLLAALAILSGRSRVQASPVQDIVADAVTAHSFTLIDRNGHRLAELVSIGDHLEMPVMRMYGLEPLAKDGTVIRLTIGVTPDPEMTVYHAFGPLEHGNDRLMDLKFLHNEPSLFLRSGRASMTGVNPGGFLFDFTEEGTPSLTVRDRQGYEAVIGGTDIASGGTGEKRVGSAASLVLSKKDGKVLWSAP